MADTIGIRNDAELEGMLSAIKKGKGITTNTQVIRLCVTEEYKRMQEKIKFDKRLERSRIKMMLSADAGSKSDSADTNKKSTSQNLIQMPNENDIAFPDAG